VTLGRLVAWDNGCDGDAARAGDATCCFLLAFLFPLTRLSFVVHSVLLRERFFAKSANLEIRTVIVIIGFRSKAAFFFFFPFSQVFAVCRAYRTRWSPVRDTLASVNTLKLAFFFFFSPPLSCAFAQLMTLRPPE